MAWKFNGKYFNLDSSDYTILETQDGKMVKSMVIIKDVKSDKLGEYECNVVNEIGTTSSVIFLKETGNH